jgi:hypothetical protein
MLSPLALCPPLQWLGWECTPIKAKGLTDLFSLLAVHVLKFNFYTEGQRTQKEGKPRGCSLGGLGVCGCPQAAPPTPLPPKGVQNILDEYVCLKGTTGTHPCAVMLRNEPCAQSQSRSVKAAPTWVDKRQRMPTEHWRADRG